MEALQISKEGAGLQRPIIISMDSKGRLRQVCLFSKEDKSAEIYFSIKEVNPGLTAFEAKFENDIALLPGVLSRKKQIIPALEEAA